MSRIHDKFTGVAGLVEPFLAWPDGRIEKLPVSHNTILSSANGIVSRLVAGESSYVPTHILFVTGSAKIDGAPAAESDYSDLVPSGSTVLACPIQAKTVHPAVNTVVFTAHSGVSEGSTSRQDFNQSFVRAILAVKSNGQYIPFSAYNFNTKYSVGNTSDSASIGLFWSLSFGIQTQTQTQTQTQAS